MAYHPTTSQVNNSSVTVTLNDGETNSILQFYSTCEGPLKNIRILDLTRIVAGPYCTMILGDLGADIIKIEKLGSGDETRRWGPPFVNDTTETCYFVGLNRNKKSVCIDLKVQEGKEIIMNLSKKCDVLIENFVPGKLNKLGLGYEDVKKVSPHIIYCSLTGYGSKGPYKQKPGYDVIAASYGGLLSITGPENGPPCKPGVAMTDIATGLYAHGAILAGLLQRIKTGQGQHIDCNLFSTQLACLINIGSNYLNAGQEGKKWGSSHASIVPYRTYETSDAEYLTIGAGSDLQFKELCNKLEINSILECEKYKKNLDRVLNRIELDDLIQKKIVKKSLKEWLIILEGSSFPFGPVNKISEVFNDKHIKEINLIKEVSHSTTGKIKMVGSPVEFSSSQNNVRLPPPILGEHTPDVTTVRFKLKKPKSRKKVNWTDETVDNENMDKKKSKCCCIYKKPRLPEDSSSSDDDNECEHCFGHVEKNKRKSNDNPTSSSKESHIQSMIAA